MPLESRRSRRLQKQKRVASVSSSSSSEEAASASSSSSDSSSDEEFHDSKETPQDNKSDDQIQFLPEQEERELLESTTAVSTTDVTAQTEDLAAAQTVNTDTQTATVFTDYPRFLDNEGEILRQLRNLRRTTSSFQARMAPSTLRGHDEARLEISRLQEKLRVFLQFHRSQIARYLASAVLEGHRNLQIDHLRKKSNEAIMPLLELMDRFKAENLNLCAQYRAPLSSFRMLWDELESLRRQRLTFSIF